MTILFADTFYFLALLNPDDGAHEEAVALSKKRKVRTVTTAWVLTEVGDAMAAPVQRRPFLAFLESIRNNPSVTIVPPTSGLFDAGVDLFARRLDKDWSLTDCISFVVMEQRGMKDALSADRHFQQAGFNTLLTRP